LIWMQGRVVLVLLLMTVVEVHGLDRLAPRVQLQLHTHHRGQFHGGGRVSAGQQRLGMDRNHKT
jgi:hypothetical protein